MSKQHDLALRYHDGRCAEPDVARRRSNEWQGDQRLERLNIVVQEIELTWSMCRHGDPVAGPQRMPAVGLGDR
jgi:hypothetical protein